MKRIVLLTDFSNSATNAIHYAMHFFKSEACTFHLMNVHKAGTFISDDLMTSPSESIYESFTKIPKQKLEALISSLKATYQNPKHDFNTIIDFDVFTDAVNQAINKHDIDYLVMGSNGATGAKEILFGSNTINVIKHVICKTLVIPNTYTFKPIVNFLLPLQFDDILGAKELDIINELTQHFKFKLHVLRSCAQEESTTTALNDNVHLEAFDCKYISEENLSFYDAVTNYLKSHAIDMTGLIIHDKSFIKRFFTESPTLELSKVIQIPLLLFHDENS